MGDLIYFSERAADQTRASLSPAAFYFALECPHSYLAAERVERALGPITWIPVLSAEVGWGIEDASARRMSFRRAARAAEVLDLPLIEPRSASMNALPAARAAAYAGHLGCAPQFALAAARLVFCGGWGVGEKRTLREAAAAAGFDSRDAIRAARDEAYDDRLVATTLGLHERVGAAAPAVRLGASWFTGEDPVAEAAASRKADDRRHWNTYGHGFGRDPASSPGTRRCAGLRPSGV